jgi:predicted Zn-dependent protease
LANLARTYALAGKRGKAEELLNQLLTIRKDGFVSSASLAQVYSALGDDDLVFENLERAYADKESLMPFVRLLGWSPSVLQDPRYQELVGRMKFPSYQ